MRRKYYKDLNDEWNFVSITDSEEKELADRFVDEYIEIIRMIESKLDKSEQKYVEAIFSKIASPAHYKFEEVLDDKREKAKTKESTKALNKHDLS